jgi:excisionase family DNA binding protein
MWGPIDNSIRLGEGSLRMAAVENMLREMPDDDYIRTAEVARLLSVSTKTVSRWAKQGRLPHVVTLGGHRRFPRSLVTELASRLKSI